MKPSMALKPLVFAIAALMAVAVQAGNDRRNDDHHHGHNNNGHHTLLQLKFLSTRLPMPTTNRAVPATASLTKGL